MWKVMIQDKPGSAWRWNGILESDPVTASKVWSGIIKSLKRNAFRLERK